MKLTKFFIIFFILTLSFVACEKSILKIMQPDDDFFLGKLKTIGDFKVENGGKNIKIGDKNYTFEKTISGLGGIYYDEVNKKYMVVVPAGDEAHTVKDITPEQKETLDKILDIVGEENSGGIIGALTTNEGFTDNKNLEGLKSNLSEEKKKELEDLISDKKLSENNLGTYEKFAK